MHPDIYYYLKYIVPVFSQRGAVFFTLNKGSEELLQSFDSIFNLFSESSFTLSLVIQSIYRTFCKHLI